jgi:hypothetical protein
MNAVARAPPGDGVDTDIPDKYRTKWDFSTKTRFRKIKRNFNDEKIDVLSSLPPNVRNLFGQIGFTKWGQTTLPVLVRNPCDVLLGQARHLWFEMYDEVSLCDGIPIAMIMSQYIHTFILITFLI